MVKVWFVFFEGKKGILNESLFSFHSRSHPSLEEESWLVDKNEETFGVEKVTVLCVECRSRAGKLLRICITAPPGHTQYIQSPYRKIPACFQPSIFLFSKLKKEKEEASRKKEILFFKCAFWWYVDTC